jgi:hypothetical protein
LNKTGRLEHASVAQSKIGGRTLMEVPANEPEISKIEGASRQVDAAITALTRGDFDIAITLAGAPEGMLDREGLHMFAYLRD